MKKFLIIFAAIVLCLTVVLCSCKGNEEADETDTTIADVEDNTDDTTDTESNTEGGENGGGNGGGKDTIPESTEAPVTNPWGEGADGAGLPWTPNYPN